MVFQDLSFGKKYSQASSLTHKNQVDSSIYPANIASLNDRVLAAFIDFFLFSPVINLLVAGIMRQIKLSSLLDVDDSMVGLFWVIYFLLMVIGISVNMTVFLFYWNATPGQKYMHLKVVVFPNLSKNDKLSFDKCLVRSLSWCLSWFSFGLPFLEVISHPLRRAFHERASDTLVVTLKNESQLGPVEIETQFVRLMLRFSFATLFCFAFAFLLHIYEELVSELGAMSTKAVADTKCKKFLEDRPQGVQFLDYLLSLNLAEVVPKECVESEISKIFRIHDNSQLPLAYYAKGIMAASDSDKELYLKKACEKSEDQEACDLARYFLDDSSSEKLSLHLKTTKPMLYSKMLLLNQHLAQKDYISALAVLKSVQDIKNLVHYFEKKYVTIVWEMRKQLDAKDNRLPASTNTAEIFKEFERKFGEQ